MYKIDIHNYEAYLLDFSEENLSDEAQMELELFLIQHPELAINLNELTLVSLEKECISFSDKANLKRLASDLVSETQFIAYVENQLTPEERAEIDKSSSINPFLVKELALYNSTIATANESIIFENKESLKRKPKVIWFNFSAANYAAAASVVFLVGLLMLWPKAEETTLSTLATNTTNKKADVKSPKNSTTFNSQNSVESLPLPQKSINTLAQRTSPNNKPRKETSIKNTATLNPLEKTDFKKDTILTPANHMLVVEVPKNETLVVKSSAPAVKPQTVVQVIFENDDELLDPKAPAKKKGIWATASRALKNLNLVGVKRVDGDEQSNKENTAYALTLGSVNITHKAGNL